MAVATKPSDTRLAWKPMVSRIVSGTGLSLIVLTGLGWLLTFPTFQLLAYRFSGDRSIFIPFREPSPIAAFFRDYPQLLWLGFALGATLYFVVRPVPSLEQTTDAKSNSATTSWFNLAWRLAGIAGLAVILLLAASVRIGDARDIGATDLIRSDFDEGVHASSALLMAQGKTVYKDFFLTQPPIGVWLWSIPLRLGGADWGGLLDFLRLRFFTSLLSLVTIGLVYLTGRKLGGNWAGPIAGLIAALALAIDGEVIRTDQQVMLEAPSNLFIAAAICAFVHYQPAAKNQKGQLLILLMAGFLAGVAFSIKAPALVVGQSLGMTLLIWRRWKGFGSFSLGLVAGFLLPCGYYLLTVGDLFIKQAYLYRAVHPFSELSVLGQFHSGTTLTAFEYMTRTPYLAFTLLGAGLGLVAIVLRWVTRSGGEMWLPVVLITVFTAFSYTAKAGFFPHYYAQMALPLALMAGGMVNFWLVKRWSGRIGLAISLVGVVLLAVLLWPFVQQAGDEPSKPEWSLERAVAGSFDQLGLGQGSLLTWDARYSFILGRPMPLDAYNRYLTDGSAYSDYVGLGLDSASLPQALRKTALDKKPSTEAFRNLRYLPVNQENWRKAAATADYLLTEVRADTQLSPQTRQGFKADFINRLEDKLVGIYSSSRFIRNQSGLLFGEKMRLVGFDASSEIKTGATKMPLTFFWRGERKIAEDYVIFVHLLNEAGDKVAQRDTAPRYGALDTSKWIPGELFDDDQSLELPPDLAPGRYKLLVGVYRPTDGKRLTVSEIPTGVVASEQADSVILFEVNVIR